MSREHFASAIRVLFILVLAACQGKNSSNAEDALVVAKSISTETPTASPLIAIQEGSSFVQMESSYFDGFIILARYYTLLDHGLYEESYPLLSSSQQKRYSFEEYTSFYSQDLQSLEITGMLPYNYWRVQQGLLAIDISPNQLRYVIFMTSYHNGTAWNDGGAPIPDNTTGFQSLILENNEWKIDEFNTSPWTK